MTDTYIRKILLSTNDKQDHEHHYDANLKLHQSITGAYGFRVISAHSPVDGGTFSWYRNTLKYEQSGTYTFPNISKLRFILTNTDTNNPILDAEILLSNNTYTSTQLQTLLTNNFANSGISSWQISGSSIFADFNPVAFNRKAELIAYDKEGIKTNHDFINIDYTPRELPKQETFNTKNNTWNYIYETLYTFPQIETIELTYDDPTSGHQIHDVINLQAQAPVFDATGFLSILNTAWSAKILATFTANLNSSTGLYTLILTGTSTSSINRIISMVAKDNQGVIIEKDGLLNFRQQDIFVPANQQIPITTISDMVSFEGKFSFTNSFINTFTFNSNTIYTSQQILDHLNNTEVEPSNASITYAKSVDTLNITNATPVLNQTFYKISKIELNIYSQGGESVIQTLDMSQVPDNLTNTSKFKAYLDYYLDGANLAGDNTTDKLEYTITSTSVAVAIPAFKAERTLTYLAYDFDGSPIYNDGALNFTGVDIGVSANATTSANITTTMSLPSLTGINATYANQTSAPRGKFLIKKNDVLGFTKEKVILNDGSAYNAQQAITLANNSGKIITFTSTMDISNKTTFNNVSTNLNFIQDEQYTEASLITFLNANFASNYLWSFDNHKLKVVSSSSNKLRLFRNTKLGLVFKGKSDAFIDIDPNATYVFESVLDGSTALNTYIGLSIYNDACCSRKPGDAMATDIVACLHNRSRDTYGDMCELLNPQQDIYPITNSQFHNIRVRTYNEDFRLNVNQHLATKVELDIYCRSH